MEGSATGKLQTAARRQWTKRGRGETRGVHTLVGFPVAADVLDELDEASPRAEKRAPSPSSRNADASDAAIPIYSAGALKSLGRLTRRDQRGKKKNIK
jgi:hypothetical protein